MSWKTFCQMNKLPKCYENADIETLPEGRREIAKKWLNNPHSAVLYGDVGRGKTHMIYSLIRALCAKYGENPAILSHFRFMKSKQMDDKMLEIWNQNGSVSLYLSNIIDNEIFFWDDFGVERATERTIREFTDIIDRRIDKPTVISTNLNPEQVEEIYGPRLFSRLKEYEWVKMGGGDMRERKNG